MDTLGEINNTVIDSENEVVMWWLGQSGLAIKSSRLTIYIDPYLSTWAEEVTRGQTNEHVRMCDIPIMPEQIDHADYLFSTHAHEDHFDPVSVPKIMDRSRQCRLVLPRANLTKAEDEYGIPPERMIPMRGNDIYEEAGIHVRAIPQMHESFDETGEGFPYLGYVIRLGEVCIYHGGDCILYPELIEQLRKYSLDVIMLPINGRDEARHRIGMQGNMDIREACDTVRQLDYRLFIPLHYDMFTINTVDINEFLDFPDIRNNVLRNATLSVGKAFHYRKQAVPECE